MCKHCSDTLLDPLLNSFDMFHMMELLNPVLVGDLGGDVISLGRLFRDVLGFTVWSLSTTIRDQGMRTQSGFSVLFSPPSFECHSR